jgi:hypothetical protein
MLLAMLLVAGGVAASLLLLSHELGSLHGSLFKNPGAGSLFSGPTTTSPGQDARRLRQPTPGAQTANRPTAPGPSAPSANSGHHHSGGVLSGLEPVLVAGIEIVAGLLLIGLLGMILVARRLRRRQRREYQLYELHLSAHDEAKPQDLEDMVESIANIVRVFPAERARSGQPYVAFELICGQGRQGMEWSINVRCEPRSVRALDGAIAAAYPDVRVGRRHADTPTPRAGTLRVPGYVMRFRKERSFVYSLIADGDELASPPLEQIARAQIELGQPSIVRFQLTPTPSYFEELARRRYRRHENKLVRQERWGLPEGGLWSTLNRAEMRAAERTQNRSLFWLETAVAADSMDACKTVAAAVQSRRGENRLHRRWMIIRQGLYRRRFPRALGPVLPSPSLRSLISAAEAAHLLALPTARMKGVPVRRVMLPRIPAPPEVMRAGQVEPGIHLAPALTNGHAVAPKWRTGQERGDPVGVASTKRSG